MRQRNKKKIESKFKHVLKSVLCSIPSLEDWKSLKGRGFDPDFVGPSADSEETLLAPIFAPAVLDDPVLGVCGFFHSISNDQYGMVCRVVGVEFKAWKGKKNHDGEGQNIVDVRLRMKEG